MTNKKEKKNALKKMLNEKPLFEMSGGGDLAPNYTNIPGSVTLGADNGAAGKSVSDLLANIVGLTAADTDAIKALGGDNFFRAIKDLDENDEIDEQIKEIIGDKATPVTPQELQAKGVMGFPMYIANQIMKSTGIYDPVLPTGMTPSELLDGNNTTFALTYASGDRSELENLSTPNYTNGGKNRFLTLYDLITDDNGKFLSPDVQFILDRFSSLAQFKHLPALEYLIQSGGKKSTSVPKKNKSRKVRK